MADRSRQDAPGAKPERPLRKLARDLPSAGQADDSEHHGPRHLMEPLSYSLPSPTLGRSVAQHPPSAFDSSSGIESRGPAEVSLDPDPEAEGEMDLPYRYRLVACEVRIAPGEPSALLDLAAARAELRPSYPCEMRSREVQRAEPSLSLASPDGNWAAWLTVGAFGLETVGFQALPEFRSRLRALEGALVQSPDTASYTRLGLRLVGDLTEDRTAALLQLGPYPRSPDSIQIVVAGRAGSVRYEGRWSLAVAADERGVLDLDLSTESVEPSALHSRLQDLWETGQRLLAGKENGAGEEASVTPAEGRRSPAGATDTRRRPSAPTTILAYPDLLPLRDRSSWTEALEREELVAEHADLLTRRFTGSDLLPTEEERLAAVARRLDELLPRVTAEDFEQLEELAKRSEARRQRSLERQRSLGLS